MLTRGWRLCALLLLAAPALAGVGTWKNFTSMKEVRGIARDGHTYWAATSGGLFQWDTSTGAFRRLTNAEGLRSIDLTAVGIDSRGDVWSGTSTGILHVYTPSTGSLRAILDISAFPGQNIKGINDLSFSGDTVLVSTEFGLSIFRLARGEFGDTFTKFGSLPNNVRLNVNAAIIAGGRIWAAITDGLSTHRVASAPITGANLLEEARFGPFPKVTKDGSAGLIEVEAPWMESISEYPLRAGNTFQIDTFVSAEDFGIRWETGVVVRAGGAEALSKPVGTIHEIDC
jgi:hypothetical protein